MGPHDVATGDQATSLPYIERRSSLLEEMNSVSPSGLRSTAGSSSILIRSNW